MKLKSLLITVLAVMLLLCSCSGSSESEIEAPDGMKAFYNEHVDYTAFVPISWNVDMSTGTMSAYYSQSDFSNISITAQGLQTAMTLDEYWAQYEESFKSTFKKMKYEGEIPTTTTLSGLAANKYVYTAKLAGETYKYMQVVCIKDATVYVITYTSDPDKYESHLDDVYKILDNFSFNK